MVLRLLGQDSCRRVPSHLEQALYLLDLLLSHAKVPFAACAGCLFNCALTSVL